MKISLCLTYLCSFTILLLSACSPFSTADRLRQVEKFEPINCIVVVPAIASAGKETSIGSAQAHSLENGAGYATDVLKETLQGHPRVRFMSFNQLSSFVPETPGGVSTTVGAIGKKMNCQGVLLTTVRRFRQRQGTAYSVDLPASVDLSMALWHTDNGKVLWSADVTEEQEALLNNLFSFNKAQKRGFQWVSVEQLMAQGIEEKLAECPYLK